MSPVLSFLRHYDVDFCGYYMQNKGHLVLKDNSSKINAFFILRWCSFHDYREVSICHQSSVLLKFGGEEGHSKWSYHSQTFIYPCTAKEDNWCRKWKVWYIKQWLLYSWSVNTATKLREGLEDKGNALIGEKTEKERQGEANRKKVLWGHRRFTTAFHFHQAFLLIHACQCSTVRWNTLASFCKFLASVIK